MRRTKGFTIVELVIVVAVIGILAAVLIPTFSAVVRKAKVSRGAQNAKQISINLTADAVFEDRTVYSVEEVVEKAKGYGYDLVSDVNGYYYAYNASDNTVQFIEEDSLVSAESDVPLTPRNIFSNPDLYYIDESDNAITNALKTIENLAFSNAYDHSAMLDAFDAAITYERRLPENVKAFLTRFSPENALYITSKGYIYTEGKSEFQDALIEKTDSLPTRSDGEPLTVFNKIYLPYGVSIIEDGAFSNLSGTLYVRFGAGLDEEKISSNNTLSVIYEGRKSVDITYLGSGDYTIDYSLSKEGRDDRGNVFRIDATYDDDLKDYVDRITIGNFSSDAIKEYALPSVALRNNAKTHFGSIKKISVKATEVNGGKAYSLIAIDNDLNVFKLSGIGVPTEAAISYAHDPEQNENIKVRFSEDAAKFANLKDAYFVLEYETAYADFETLGNRLNGDNFYLYEDVYFSGETKYISRPFTTETDLTIDLTNDQVRVDGEEKSCNFAAARKLTVFLPNGLAIYSEKYE